MSPCHRCGATNDPSSRFCVACGAPLAARSNPMPIPAAAQPAPHPFVAPPVPSTQPAPAPGSAQFGANMAPFGLPPPSDLPFAETAAPLTREEFEQRAQAEAAASTQAQRAMHVASPVPAPARHSAPPPAPAPARNSAPPPVPSYLPNGQIPQPSPTASGAGYLHSSSPPANAYAPTASVPGTAAMPGVEQDPELVPERAPRILAGFLVSYDVEPMGRFWPIYQGKNRLGRKGSGTDLDIELDHPTTSSRHATILAAACPGRLKLEDTGSTNGTLLNGVRVAPGTRPELKDGDRVRFGLLSAIVKVV